MKDNRKDLTDALNAFLTIGKMSVLEGKADKKEHDRALKILNGICAKNKITIDQLGQTIMGIVQKG